MNRRLQTMERLLGLYDAIEAQRALEAQRAEMNRREAETAIEQQRALARMAAGEQRRAWIAEDRMGWASSVVRQEVAHARETALRPVLAAREQEGMVAQARFRESHMGTERVRVLVERMQQEQTMLFERRAQAQADERHLARWSGAVEGDAADERPLMNRPMDLAAGMHLSGDSKGGAG